MFDSILLFLALLFVKHWYVDFVNQSAEEVAGKGIYGNAHGIMHSMKQGIGTLLASMMFLGSFEMSLSLAFIDFLAHYHIDWLKININKRYNYTTQDKQFWVWLGADQLAHSLTYLLLVWLAV